MVEIMNTEELYQRIKTKCWAVIPHVSRICLVSTFLSSCYSLWYGWDDQHEYLLLSWGPYTHIATLFLLLNLIGQLGAVAMVLTRCNVRLASFILLGLLVLQGVVYKELWKIKFLCRNLSLIGSLLLVMAESIVEEKSLPAGLPSLGENKLKKYLLLAGRILLLFMFEMVLRFQKSSNDWQIFQNLLGTILILLFTFGYKTRITAAIMVIWMSSLNLYYNPWWAVSNEKQVRILLQYEFFQRVSVIGGLLMLVHLGAGQVSLDQQKKNW